MKSIKIRPCPVCCSPVFKIRFISDPFLVVRCSQCSLVYLGNPPDEQDIYDQRYYRDIKALAAEYRPGGGHPPLVRLHAINEQRISMIKNLRESGQLLDIGCGPGYFLKTAQNHGFQVQGIDISEGVVEQARNSFGLNAKVRSLDDLLASAGKFDVITLWHVLEHFTEPLATLSQIRSLLAENGVAFIEVPNIHSLKFMLSRQKWQGGNHPLYHRTFFSDRTLRYVLKKAKFARTERLRLSYKIPGASMIYHDAKSLLNWFALDAFLCFAVER